MSTKSRTIVPFSQSIEMLKSDKSLPCPPFCPNAKMRALSSCWKRVVWGNTAQLKQRLLTQTPAALPRYFAEIVWYCLMGVLHLLFLDCPGACAVFRPTGPDRFLKDWLLTQSDKRFPMKYLFLKGWQVFFSTQLAVPLLWLQDTGIPCLKYVESLKKP